MIYFCSHCGSSMHNLQSCPSCHAPSGQVAVASHHDEVTIARPAGYPMTEAVATYQGRGAASGTQSTHVYAGRDAMILDHVSAASMMLEQVAKEMRGFASADQETRNLIRQVVTLAADMQNEVDRRKGKQL